MAPAAYLVVAQLINQPLETGGEYDMMFYILLIIAITTPLLIPIIERVQINGYKKNKNSQGTPMGMFQTLFIQKAAIVEATYIYGLVVMMTSGNFTRMLYFYPIGILWTLIYFPRKAHFEKFMEKIESYETTN